MQVKVKTLMWGVAYGVISFFAAVVLLWPLNVVFTRMRWPLLNTWELIHGAILIAVPGLAVLCFPLVAYAGQRLRKGRGRA